MIQIESPQEALRALQAIKSKSLSVRVNVSMANLGVGFEGRIWQIDWSRLTIAGEAGKDGTSRTSFSLSNLPVYSFFGEWEQTPLGISMMLTIIRSDLVHNPDAARITLNCGPDLRPPTAPTIV